MVVVVDAAEVEDVVVVEARKEIRFLVSCSEALLLSEDARYLFRVFTVAT